ncbi:hypothetical protein SAMN02745121_01256 [Nannocystis exedens]|uniref:Pectate lyase superfamily protein n=1 Tax=Nannocystis exedens TaxID=54 RepID=A0A1I1UUT2_9BACT|nr:peptidoglycan-binding protein [Nannocystis exedens]PCC72047.1 hypothetical protein NAEX_05126 [Nannocystis exedens]SFD73428.1 hypothetical protein SAMN02745121_01256 [Nannocystis exedens]
MLSSPAVGPRRCFLVCGLFLVGSAACPGGGAATTDASGSETAATGDPTPTTGTATTGTTVVPTASADPTVGDGTTSGPTTTAPGPDLGGATSEASSTGDDGTTGAAQCPPPLEQPPGSWTSQIVPVEGDALTYVADDQGNRIPDFSWAGYHRGEAPIPDVPMVLGIEPVAGDNTAHLQQAIDELGATPLGVDGLRGALLLAPGEYEIHGTVRLRHSGVVLRGAGDGDDPATSTILRAIGDEPHQRVVLVVGSGDNDRWQAELPDTRSDIVSERVPVGARTFEVADPSLYAVGDHVVIVHPCTDAWLAAVDHGGTGDDAPWTVDSQPLVFKRQILAIDGAALTIDAPVFNHLDRSLSQSYVYKLDREGLVTEVGVEDLRIDIETQGGDDEDHAWSAIAMRGVEDAWVRRFTALHFGFAAVTVQTGTQVTVADARALDPVAQITGERMYNFDVSNAQQVLFTGCHATNGRHHFVSNGTSYTSGVVFHRSTSTGPNASSEGHRRWSMGLLYDNVVESAPAKDGLVVLGLYNRGDYGTGHGWASAHSVAWNYATGDGVAVVQRPPTAQNYAIGGSGTFSGDKPPAPFDQPAGYIEGSDQAGLVPESLYERQLAERLCGR